MNAVGLQRDVETILHEAGHAFHGWQALVARRDAHGDGNALGAEEVGDFIAAIDIGCHAGD